SAKRGSARALVSNGGGRSRESRPGRATRTGNVSPGRRVAAAGRGSAASERGGRMNAASRTLRDNPPPAPVPDGSTSPAPGQELAGDGSTTTGGSLEGSAEAKRLAAAILEALAGVRGPAEVAQALGISLARYYQVETRALGGLLAACEPRRRGGRHRPVNEL